MSEVPEVLKARKIEAAAQAIHKAMQDWDNDVSDMGDYDWNELVEKDSWLAEGQDRFRRLAKAALEAKP